MIRINNVRLPLDYGDAALPRAAAKLLGVPGGHVRSTALVRRSVDARKKNDVHFVCSLDVALADAAEEKRIAARLDASAGGIAIPYAPPSFPRPKHPPETRPVVVGFGPAGLFAALTLAEAGLRPIVLERGRDVERRTQDVAAYWERGQAAFSPVSNVQFGEGGAGTFSDGKLNTGIKDPYAEHVLRTFVRFGAPQDILIDAKPHIGTDKLAPVVRAMRERIIALGGEVRFEAKLTHILRENGHIARICYEADGQEQELPCRELILAIGHSARDTFEALLSDGFTLVPKPFSIGARIEHPQSLIDCAQYGPAAGHPRLAPADYKLSCHLQSGRGVYTFCMCPGGTVVAAASEPESVVTNGMSRYARDGENANAALLVGIGPEDFASEHPLAGMYLQRDIERRAFLLGGGTGAAPCQSVGSLLGVRGSSTATRPSYRPGVTESDLSRLLPPVVTASMREALPLLGRRLRGFDAPEALLTGPETRSSSPVRMPRDERTVSLDAAGLHPCGEGAGYAGGITSAAVDGLRCAASVLQALAEESP